MRVLVYYSKLNIGGAERSNVRLMKKMVEADWDVTLLLRYGGGSMESEIPEGVRTLYLRESSDFLKKFRQKNILKKISGCSAFLTELFHEKRTLRELKKESFDISIIGLQGLDAKIIKKNVYAKKRLLWIRNDLRSCDPTGKVKHNIIKNKRYIDYYPCVSQTALDSFTAVFPKLKSKAVMFYNVIDKDEMIKASYEQSAIDGKYTDALKVLSVCRISDKAKGVFRMLDIYEKLRTDGIFFYWLIAGDGNDFEELKYRTEQKKLQDGFILLGHQPNPFPLYRRCDIVAVLSYYEGLCGTVNEAKVIGKPVIATDFSGIHEQILNEHGGLIVENSFEGAYAGLKRILTDKALQNKLTNNYLPQEIIDDNYKLQWLGNIIEK